MIPETSHHLNLKLKMMDGAKDPVLHVRKVILKGNKRTKASVFDHELQVDCFSLDL